MKEIQLSRGMFAMVDDEDYQRVSEFKWSINGSYANTVFCFNKKQFRIPLHQFIVGEIWVDHKDGNGLNNQKSNLRRCTHSENMRNRKIQKNSTTGIPGVHYLKNANKYTAQIQVNKKTIYLGIYLNINEAKKARVDAVKKYHKEFGAIY